MTMKLFYFDVVENPAVKLLNAHLHPVWRIATAPPIIQIGLHAASNSLDKLLSTLYCNMRQTAALA